MKYEIKKATINSKIKGTEKRENAHPDVWNLLKTNFRKSIKSKEPFIYVLKYTLILKHSQILLSICPASGAVAKRGGSFVNLMVSDF